MSNFCCPPTITPNCLINENLRQELIQSCGQPVDIHFCCCFNQLSFEGEVLEVGADFVKILAPRVQTGTFPAIVVIPLSRISAFFELTNFPPTSDCDTVTITTGILTEIGTDFIQLQNIISEVNAGTDLVIPLNNICAVEQFEVPMPTIPCPTPLPIVPTTTPPTPTPTPSPTPSCIRTEVIIDIVG